MNGSFLSPSNKVCVLVTSVMIPWNQSRFDYMGLRSVFSQEERIAQTMETLDSIRKKLSWADVLFIEGGIPPNAGVMNDVAKYLGKGKLVLGSNCSWVRKAVSGKSKAMGEIALMLYARCFFRKNKYDYFFKLSGRYKLNDDFDISKWRMDKISGKDIYGDKSQISTRLIGIPNSMLSLYYYALLRRIWRVPTRPCVLENYVLKGIGVDNVYFFEPIGLEGYSGGEESKNALIRE